MSLNNIKFPNRLLVDLYRNSLIEHEKTIQPESVPVQYLGNNAKQVLILVNYPSLPFLPDEQLNFLTTVLSACRLSLADIAVINLAGSTEEQIKEFAENNSLYIILFGLEPVALNMPINFPAFQVQRFGKQTYLHAPALEVIEKETSLKKLLWASLKSLFKL